MLSALRTPVRRRSLVRFPLLTLMSLLIALALSGAAGADPLAQWQWRNPQPQGNGLRSVATGPVGFVAVGDAGTIVTSTDGTAWSPHLPTGNTSDLKSICYGKKKFVAVGAAGTILSSADGRIWTDLTANFRLPSGATTRPSLNAIAYGNNQFYAVGDGGTLLSSPDGVTWTNNTNTTGLTSQNLSGVAYSNYTFVAVGANGTILTLLNQGSWQLAASGSANALNAVAASRTRFVAVGAAGTILSSPDGITWSQQASPTANALFGVGFGTTHFAAAGANGTLLTWDESSPWSAVDPANVGPAPVGTTTSLNGVVFGSSVFAVVGASGMIVTASEPAAVWTKRLAGPAAGLKSISYGNGAYIAVGAAGAVLRSTDGSTWASMSSGTSLDLNSVAFGENEFLAVGNGGIILSSIDGVTWSSHFSGTGNFNSVVYDSRPAFARFVAVGDAGAVVYSADGAVWSTVTPPTVKNLKGIVLGDSLLVAVGQGGVILTSPDGLTWTSRTGVTKDLNAIAVAFKTSGATTYVAAGAAGTLVYSTDAVKWSQAKTLPAAYKTTAFNAVSCDFDSTFSTFVAVGNGGAVLASSDAQTWSEKPRVTGLDLAGVSYLNSAYWAVSDNGIVLSSNRLDNYIAISATRKDTGQVVASDLIDFGYLDAGMTSFPISLKISNTGQTRNLTVSSLTLGGPNAAEFTLGVPSCGATPVIAPGGSCSVDLGFKPTSVSGSAKSATLTIVSDDSAVPVYPVPLSGRGGLYLVVRPGANGSVLSGSSSGVPVSGQVAVSLGATPSFFMSPAGGYYTQEVVVDGESLGPVSSYVFPPVVLSQVPRTLEALFSNAQHTVTASATGGGALLPGSGAVLVAHNATQPFAIQPNLGHHLESLLVDGTPVASTSLYTFRKVTANHTLDAEFQPNVYSVTASADTNGAPDSAGTGGTLTPGSVAPAGGCSFAGNAGSCDYNTSLTYTIAPKPGYRLINVLVDNASLGATGSYSFNSIAANHTIKAIFTNQYDITVSYGGALAVAANPAPNGSVTPAPSTLTGIVPATSGQGKTFSFAANDGYDILDVKVDDASYGPITSFTFSPVVKSHTLDVSFVPRSYPINISAGPNGKILAADGSALPAQISVANHGTKVLSIVPDPQYEVADVLVDGVSVSALKTYVFTDVTRGHTIEARFRGKKRYLTLSLSGTALPIGGISFTVRLPGSASLPVNPDPGAPLGEVDPDALTVLAAAAGSKFEVSLPPAAGVAAGTARVALVSGPGFTPGAPFLKIGYYSSDPAGSFTPNVPDVVTDTSGNSIAGAVVITAATSAAPASQASPAGGIYNAAQSIALSASPAGAEIHYRTDGGDPSELSPLYKSDNSAPVAITGTATLKYFALDRTTGNKEPVRSELYVIDKGTPTALVTGAPPALTRLTSATLQVSGRDVVSYKYLLDSATKLTSANSAPETPVATAIQLGVPTPLSDGIHKLQVIGKDTAGNWQATATSVQWTVDTALPATSISPAAGVYNAPVSVVLANAKATAKVYYTLSGQPVSYQDALGNTRPTPEALLYTAPIPITASTTVRYFALDTAGNAEAESSVTYTVLMLGVDPPLSPAKLSEASPILTGSVTPGTPAPSGPATVRVSVVRGINAPTGGLATVAGNRWSYDMASDPGGALLPGLNAITVTATDTAVPPNRISQTVYVRVNVLACAVPDGDIDRDGMLTMSDVTLALQMVAGLIPQDTTSCGDVWPVNAITRVPSRDGSVGVNDALFILQKVMGIPSFLP